MSGTGIGMGGEGIPRTLAGIAAASAFLSVAAGLFDIVAGSIVTAGLPADGLDAAGRLAMMAEKPLLGIYLLDFLNLLVSWAGIPLYLALLMALRERAPSLSRGAFSLFVLGTAVFTSSNAALPMLDLARSSAGVDAAGSAALSAAAEALLSRGAHGSPGALPGFLLSSLAAALMALAALRGGGFGRIGPVLGFAGALSLCAYLVVVTWVPGASSVMVALAAPGGIASMAWTMLCGIAFMGEARRSRQGPVGAGSPSDDKA